MLVIAAFSKRVVETIPLILLRLLVTLILLKKSHIKAILTIRTRTPNPISMKRRHKAFLMTGWSVCLPCKLRKTLSVLLMESFKTRQKMSVMGAAQEAASITGYNEKTVRLYRKFFSEKGKVKESRQGKYKRHCLLNDENLRFDAAIWVRENAYKKGGANMTAKSFCQWVNDHLFPPMICLPTFPERFPSGLQPNGSINLDIVHYRTRRVLT